MLAEVHRLTIKMEQRLRLIVEHHGRDNVLKGATKRNATQQQQYGPSLMGKLSWLRGVTFLPLLSATGDRSISTGRAMLPVTCPLGRRSSNKFHGEQL
jgi:hypothetical protein